MDKVFVKEQFKQRFGSEGVAYASPGRINLIGEHTDYNGGFVFPGAVDTPLYNLDTTTRKVLRALGVMSSAESIARKGLRAMHRRRRTLVPGLFTKFVVLICRLLPAVALLPVIKIPAIRRILDRL